VNVADPVNGKLWINGEPADVSSLGDILEKDDITSLRSHLAEESTVCSVFDGEGGDKGALLLSVDKYDTGFFGSRMGKLVYLGRKIPEEAATGLFEKVLLEAGREDYSYLFFKIPEAHSFLKGTTEKQSFSSCGINIDFRLNLDIAVDRTKIGQLSPNVRFIEEKDKKEVSSIAGRAFHKSRLYRTGLVEDTVVDRYHQKWIVNLMGNVNDTVFVVEGGQGIEGFLALRLDCEENSSRIILVAIDADKRRKGLGSLLMENAINWASGKAKVMYVKTQEHNVPAVNCYERFGFVKFDREYGYHKILTGPDRHR